MAPNFLPLIMHVGRLSVCGERFPENYLNILILLLRKSVSFKKKVKTKLGIIISDRNANFVKKECRFYQMLLVLAD